jgi:type IV secretion system protein VirB9
VPPPTPEKPTPAEQVLDFTPGTTFSLTVPVGAPLDIVMQRGEEVRNVIGGDRAPVEANQTTRWELKEGAHGLGDTLQHHIFLSATLPSLSTGLIVTTTRRTYYLQCKSVAKSPIRTVRWRYPVETTDPLAKLKVPPLLPDPAQPKHYHVGYELVGTKPHWQPRQVVDDGRKTYILYPEVALFETVPMVRLIGPNGPQLVNARQFLNVVILDQLLPRAELRVGLGETAEVVTITRGQMRTIACPGDEACPVWPAAAQVLAQRSPPVQPPPAPTPPPEPQPRTHVPAPVAPPVSPPPATPAPEGAQP